MKRNAYGCTLAKGKPAGRSLAAGCFPTAAMPASSLAGLFWEPVVSSIDAIHR